jgi:hypothetical protein
MSAGGEAADPAGGGGAYLYGLHVSNGMPLISRSVGNVAKVRILAT